MKIVYCLMHIVPIVPEKCFETRRMLCVALRTARNSPVHSNGVINYAFVVRLFRTELRDRLKNFSRYNSDGHVNFSVSRRYCLKNIAILSSHNILVWNCECEMSQTNGHCTVTACLSNLYSSLFQYDTNSVACQMLVGRVNKTVVLHCLLKFWCTDTVVTNIGSNFSRSKILSFTCWMGKTRCK